MLYWKAYVEAVLGVEVLEAQEKFDSLCEAERKAWEAVAAVQVVQKPVVAQK